MSRSVPSPGLVEALVRACRARIAAQLRTRDGFLAVGVLLAGICSLLLLGTRYVPVVLLPLAAGLGAWLAVRRWKSTMPEAYAVAQRIDGRVGLADQIATAYYFRAAREGAFSERFARSQYEQAAETAALIEPESVFPKSAPSTQRTALALLCTAVLFFGLRAGLQSSLSFEPPLASLLMASLFGYVPEDPPPGPLKAARIDQAAQQETELSEEDASRSPLAEPDASATDLPEEQYQEEAAETDEMPEVEGLITLPLEDAEVAGQGEDASLAADQGDDGMAANEDAAEMPPDPSDDGWSDESQSLLDKLKQAFENMLQTLDMASVESSDSESGKEQGSGTSEESNAAGDPADSGEADQEMAAEGADASMEGGEPGDEAGETASAGNTSGEDSSGDESSGENASAAGSSDGSKELVEAEQMEVLGALEELYMERAENMKGDVTIETRLAEQSASVPYNQQSTAHADRGGAVSRDEIPAAYRTYIQNYFEALRRTAE